MEKLYINDVLFSHSFSSSWYNKPTNFEWVRTNDEEHLFFTDDTVFDIEHFNNKKKFAWLVESPEFKQNSYDFIKYNHNLFDKIFTFDKNLLEISDKFVFTPIGGCWIDESDRKIHIKNKLVSFIMSSKMLTSGHRLRHEVNKKLTNVDKYGFENPIQNKIDGLRDYMFSIVIENCSKDYYFTEKIVDCFISGTIPIYWGCPSIGDFFDANGFFTFNTIDELMNILYSIDEETYKSKIEIVKKNFECAKKYIIADDLIYDYYKYEN